VSCDTSVHMDDVLLGMVLDRLDHRQLAADASDLLLAALDGEESLAAQLSAPKAERYVPTAPDAVTKDPVGAYLSEVTVAGFRGIGAPSTLKVEPGPGLTLVVGRNGSGKSSFAEALEVLLTGTLLRWANAPVVVREGWRSKHASGAPEITAGFLIEGKGQAVVKRSWPAGAGSGNDVAQSTAWVQVHGEKRDDMDTLGWDAALSEHRPFLSHTELEAFFGTPAALHDLLASVLGLEDLLAADKSLNAARKQREDTLAAAKKELEPVAVRLQALADHDERAKSALAALAASNPAKWDIPSARSVASGGHTTEVGGQLAALRRLTQVSAPSATEAARAAADLRSAAEALEQVQGTAAAQARDLAGLLDAALTHHQAHGDGDCPVCGNIGALTTEWRTATEGHRDQLRAQAAAADEAVAKAKNATERARLLLRAAPPALAGVAADGAYGVGLDVTPARTAWQNWANEPVSDATTPAALNSLADHLTETLPALTAAVDTLVSEAERELARRDDQWAPLAATLAAWCADAEAARAGHQPVAALKAARTWLADAMTDFREQRLAPLANQSKGIWEDLRQESNVELGAFRLTGINTSRKLELNVSIDGEPGAALGVMSQGEINALALSIFLPRATMPESPFRFLVIDDPVQAMDPAKVDGLAKVLYKVAAHRQVLVFTHDNRLASAVRDLDIPATILEVTRQPRSHVTVRECLAPSEQALKDAGALNMDDKVPDDVARRVIPGLCRTAVEAAFAQAYWRSQLRAGRSRSEIEAAFENKNLKLTGVAALALLGDAKESHRVVAELEKRWGKEFGTTVNALNKGSHQLYTGHLGNLVGDSRKLVKTIGEKLP
jgi:energy-coupling factor transporter ATP-binding protein EcfA2